MPRRSTAWVPGWCPDRRSLRARGSGCRGLPRAVPGRILRLLQRGVRGEGEGERAAAARFRRDPDAAAMPFDDPLADVEPEARARDLHVLLAAHPLELLEQPAHLV